MSIIEHCINGYGIEFGFDDGKNTTVEKIEKLLSKAPNLKNKIKEWFSDMGVAREEQTVELYSEFEQDYRCGIPSLIAFAINEKFNNKIKIEFLRDVDGKIFIFYCSKNPWEMNDFEKSITKEKLKNIFEEYYMILYGNKPIVDNIMVYNVG